MKRALALLLSASLTLSLAACGGGGGGTSQSGSSGTTSSDGAGELTATQQIIQEAQGMTLEELAQKAIEESNGQKFYGVIPATPWSLNGSSPRTTKSSIS